MNLSYSRKTGRLIVTGSTQNRKAAHHEILLGCIPKALKQFQVTPRPTHPQPNLESPRRNPEATNRVAVRRYPGAPARLLIRSPNCKRKPKLAGIGRRSRCKMGPPADDEGVPWPRRVRLSGLVPYHLSTATQRPLGCQALQEEESFFFVVPSHLLDPPTEGEPGCTSSAILKPCLRLRIVRSFATLYCLFRLPRPAVIQTNQTPDQ